MAIDPTQHQVFQPFPKLDSQIANPDGTITFPWQRLLITLWTKSGGGNSPADITLTSVNDNVQAALVAANAAVATANAAVASASAANAAVVAETVRAEAAEATLLPRLGVTDGSDAPPGELGEFLSSVGAFGTQTNGVIRTVTSLVLGPGDWDVEGNVTVSATGGAVMQSIGVGINSVSGAFPAIPGPLASAGWGMTVPANTVVTFPLNRSRFSSAGPQSAFLLADAAFLSGAVAAAGFLSARRVR